MRSINLKQLLKIMKGEDLEFRISPFAFRLTESATIRDAHLPYDLNFQNCHFENLSFENCRFSGSLEFVASCTKALSFDTCLLHNLEIEEANIAHLSLRNSYELRALIIKDSNVNELHLEDNPIYETIHLGCGNHIRNCTITNNGAPDRNSFSTKVFICPERFEGIKIKNLTTDILHIGTFGQYAQLSVTDVNAEMVLIDGCSPLLSKVSFENVTPLDEEASALHLVNTVFDQVIFNTNAFKNYKITKIHHEKVDVSTLMA